jgi:hypothetical protein
VRVGVEGDPDGRVSQEFLYELGMYAAGEQDCGAGVPKVVEADRGQPRALERPLEGSVGEQVGAQKTACAVGEDEVAVLPEWPPSLSLSVFWAAL